MIRLGILGSTRGSNLLPLLLGIQQGTLAASIEVVLSNKQTAPILERARSFGLLAEFVSPKDLSREAYDKQLSQILQAHQVELVVLIGYMRILSPYFTNLWKNRVINVHPSLLPAFAGKMDLEVHQAVLDAGMKETGCTVHYVTEAVDAGPILVQKTCAVLADDTAERLKERVQQLEGAALIASIKKIIGV
jgi:phosphoribosylglycinamide formyltransferase-1